MAREQNSTIGIEMEDGIVSEDPEKVAKTLNQYFKDKVVNLRKDLQCSVEESLKYTEEYLQDREIEGFEFHQVSRKSVKEIIKNLEKYFAAIQVRIETLTNKNLGS